MEGQGSSLCPAAETALDWGEAGNRSGEFLPGLFSGGRPPVLAESGVGPLTGRVTSHISHLIPQLCIFWLSLVFFVLLF